MEYPPAEQIERALNEWITALDVIQDPIFLHDKDFRIIRCNKAYQHYAGLSYPQIIGQFYYDVFPINDGPLPHCRRAKEDAHTDSAEDEVRVGSTLFRSRSYVVSSEAGTYLYSIHILENITDQKHAEHMLRQEKHFSEKLIESIPDIFFLIDKQGRLIQWNKRVEQLMGIAPEQLRHSSALQFVHDGDKEQVKHRLSETLADGNSTSEARLLTKNGIRHYALTTKQVVLPGGDAIIGIGIDITKRKNVERQILRERDFNRDLVETAPAIILVRDLKGRITRFNRYMETLSGYAFDEVKDRSWFELFIPETDREHAENLFQHALSDLPTNGYSNAIMTREGEARQIEWYDKRLQDAHGNTEGLLSIGMDITEQRKLLEQLELFHSLFDKSMDAVHIVDPETMRFLDINETACRQLGYSRETLMKKSVLDIDPNITPERTKSIIAGIDQDDNMRFESINRRRDGSTFPVEVSISITKVDKPYFLAIVRDISEAKASEAALNRANRALRTLSEGNLALVRATDEKMLLRDATRVIVEYGGYSLAVVHYVENGPDKRLNPVAWAGYKKQEYWIEDQRCDATVGGVSRPARRSGRGRRISVETSGAATAIPNGNKLPPCKATFQILPFPFLTTAGYSGL
ncbi:PAS domain S-box protein [Sulfurimonas sp. HSL1-6]|uniref:PAS domain-containing protein n=1 Tax=Thiomicrolovo immobilis TaxID=3131935 RepID=UPI0031F830CC